MSEMRRIRNNKKIKKLAEQYFDKVYMNRWRGSTMRNIVITSYAAGYKQRKDEEE